PLITSEGFVGAIQSRELNRFVVPSQMIPGVELKSMLLALQYLRRTSEVTEDHAFVRPCFHFVRIQFESTLAAKQSFLEPPTPSEAFPFLCPLLITCMKFDGSVKAR